MKKSMKASLQIITIGSIFLLCGTSFFGIISMKDEGISSGFWNIRQLAITTTYADDDRDDENDDDRDDNNDRDDENDDDRDDGNQYTAPVSPTPVTTTSPTPSTSTQTCTTVYDTVTNASGTATQVPRQSCTTVPTPVTAPVTTPVIPTTPVVTPITTPIIPTGSQFKDGTYTGIGKYSFAGGNVNYSVSITIASGKITQASFVNFTASGN